jgi:hypothetical protein
LDTLGSEEVTAALPAPAETEELSEISEADAAQDALAPEPEPDDEQPLNAVASVDADETPVVVPIPLRKPALNQAVEERKAATPEPRKHVTAHRPRARVTTKRASKKFLGGRTATPMPEYPF